MGFTGGLLNSFSCEILLGGFQEASLLEGIPNWVNMVRYFSPYFF